MSDRIGFMQGRLSPMVGGRIQAFPHAHWRDEFVTAERHGFSLMEWTLDQDRLYENPLLTPNGQAEIRALSARHGVAIPALTGDCFMQAPWWKVDGGARVSRQRDWWAVATACAAIGISLVVIPLVDGGRLENAQQEEDLVADLQHQSARLQAQGLRIAFESDYAPSELARFIGRFDPSLFGVNYDTGNSAALGFDADEEIAAYGRRIVNVHVKDRVRGGTTVALGTGGANFAAVFAALGRVAYAGNYILQTARAVDSDHADVLCRYRDMTAAWVASHGA